MFKDGPPQQLGQRGGATVRQQDPTPEQIVARCAVIRMGWSEYERSLRWQLTEFRQRAPHCPEAVRILSGLR